MDNYQAKELINQLGGNKFIAMTGAKNFAIGDNGLTFKLGRFPHVKINCIQIQLNSLDLYDIKFMRVYGMKCTTIKEMNGIYAEDLQRIFTSVTGLDTHL